MNINPQPKRGFSKKEYELRLSRAQKIMHQNKLDGIFVTNKANFRYFTGFDSQFWESPTRPWFLVIPGEGEPIAVIPEIGVTGITNTWISDISTWSAPNPEDDGISLLVDKIKKLGNRFGKVGAELGREMSLRMPIIDFMKLKHNLGSEIVDASPAIWEMRMIKTEAEIQHIKYICSIVSAAYDEIPNKICIGDSERDAAQKLRKEIYQQGADTIPFLPAISGKDGVSQIVCGPSDRILNNGDILFFDTGSTYDGYFCDFDRNFGIGTVSDEVRRAHHTLWRATEAGIAAAVPGAKTDDIWSSMNKIIEEAGNVGNSVGRLGHGVGLQLTEPPSHCPGDNTDISENMVLTIEPGIEYKKGKMIVHEENIVVTRDGPLLLTQRVPKEMPIIR